MPHSPLTTRVNGRLIELIPLDAQVRATLAGAAAPMPACYEVVRKHDRATIATLAIERRRTGPLRAELRALRAHAELAELPRLLALLLHWQAPRRAQRVGTWVGDLRRHWQARAGASARHAARALRRATRAARTGSVDAARRTLVLPADYAAARNLARQHEPLLLVAAGIDVRQRVQWLVPPAARAWRAMREAARRDGIVLQLVSAYRDVAYQVRLLERKLERGQDLARILSVNAAPGYSEHHSGRAVDVTTPGHAALDEAFERSPAFRWLQDHAGRFGFRLSFPRDNPHGIAFEPWHWCRRREP
jgi:D-alanyl-D-alanine carboxypeptidase